MIGNGEVAKPNNENGQNKTNQVIFYRIFISIGIIV